jgi:hypothetical protein
MREARSAAALRHPNVVDVLDPEHPKTLKLRPGSYRLEAQSAGSPAAFAVATVGRGVPMDVFLQR